MSEPESGREASPSLGADRPPPAPQEQARQHAAMVTGEAVDAALLASTACQSEAPREALWPSPSRRQARAMLEAAAPFIAAPAEARLAAIAEHCRQRMNAPGRSGMTRAAAEHILSLAESTEGDPSHGRLAALLREWRSRG